MDDKSIVSISDIDVSSTNQQSLQIAQKILDADNIDQIKDLTHLFNLNMNKKNVMRALKMNDLLDKVTDKVMERFEKTPDNFSNDDLIKYMQVTETAIEKANKQLNLVDETPAIQLQQNNQVNVNIIDSFDKDSRERVADAIKSILSGSVIDATAIQNADVANESEDEK